jgi:hypothetical protein
MGEKRAATLVEVVRALGGNSSWDGPGWTLHVPKRYAEALFDAAYDHDSETLRGVLADIRSSSPTPPTIPRWTLKRGRPPVGTRGKVRRK